MEKDGSIWNDVDGIDPKELKDYKIVCNHLYDYKFSFATFLSHESYIWLWLGNIGIYCHDISWQNYHGITIHHNIVIFSNYTIECIILVYTFHDSYTLHEVYIFRLLSSPLL